MSSSDSSFCLFFPGDRLSLSLCNQLSSVPSSPYKLKLTLNPPPLFFQLFQKCQQSRNLFIRTRGVILASHIHGKKWRRTCDSLCLDFSEVIIDTSLFRRLLSANNDALVTRSQPIRIPVFASFQLSRVIKKDKCMVI